MFEKASCSTICLVILSFIFLNGCSSKSQLEKQLIGSWQGKNADDGVEWCFEFADDGELTLSTLQKPKSWIESGASWHDEGRLVTYPTEWMVADGRRVMMAWEPTAVVTENRSEEAKQLPSLRMSNFLIVTNIDESGFRATRHKRGKEGFWMESKKVENCADYFMRAQI